MTTIQPQIRPGLAEIDATAVPARYSNADVDVNADVGGLTSQPAHRTRLKITDRNKSHRHTRSPTQPTPQRNTRHHTVPTSAGGHPTRPEITPSRLKSGRISRRNTSRHAQPTSPNRSSANHARRANLGCSSTAVLSFTAGALGTRAVAACALTCWSMARSAAPRDAADEVGAVLVRSATVRGHEQTARPEGMRPGREGV